MERFRKRRSDGYEAAVASNSSKWKGNSFSKVIFLSFKIIFFYHPVDPFRVQWKTFGGLRSVERRSKRSKEGYVDCAYPR